MKLFFFLLIAFLAFSSVVQSASIDLNNATNFQTRWNGGAASDQTGYILYGESSIRIENIDGGAVSNDLLIDSPSADVNGKTNVGALYLIKNISSTSGVKDLSNLNNFDVRFNGHGTGDYLGSQENFGHNFILTNIDGGAYSNDLLIPSQSADANMFGSTRVNAGVVYLVRNIDSLSGSFDFANPANYSAAWFGATATAQLGYTNNGGTGIIVANTDGGAYPNDLVLASPNADVNGITNAGAVYLILNVDAVTGANDLNNPSDYSVAWFGASTSDYFGSDNSGRSIQVASIDENGTANDLIITAFYADVNSKTNNGAVYLIKNAGSLSGTRGMGNLDNFDVRWSGAENSALFGGAGSKNMTGVEVVNVDNGSYANDLLVGSTNATVGAKSTRGTVHLLKNVDGLSGSKDLNSLDHFDVRWNGGTEYDNLGWTWASREGFRLVNVDEGAYANDLVISAQYASVSGRQWNGAFYLMKNIDALSGVKDLNYSINFDVRWEGGEPGDSVGRTGTSINGFYGPGFQLIDLDNTGFQDDLILSAMYGNVLGRTDAGVVYLIKNIGSLSGAKDLNLSSGYSVRWIGASSNDYLGYAWNGQLVQVLNADGGAYSNDLLLTVPYADVNNRSDAGIVYMLLGVDQLSGTVDMNLSENFSAAWYGSGASDLLGSNTVVSGAQVVNLDNGSFANDVLITSTTADFNGGTTNGAVYAIQGIDSLSGLFDINVASSSSATFFGAPNDTLGSSGGAPGFFFQNLGDDAYANDFLFVGSDADTNGKTDAGVIYLLERDFDSTAPVTTADYNGGTQATDANVVLTCTDSDAGCGSTQYRVDSDAGLSVSMGSWQTFDSNILITSDGNWAIDFNSTDLVGNRETTRRIFVLIARPGSGIAGGPRFVCPNNVCEPDENAVVCPLDCPNVCGDRSCTHTENNFSCPFDCAIGCGNGICDVQESDRTCPTDCGRQPGEILNVNVPSPTGSQNPITVPLIPQNKACESDSDCGVSSACSISRCIQNQCYGGQLPEGEPCDIGSVCKQGVCSKISRQLEPVSESDPILWVSISVIVLALGAIGYEYFKK
ncbi:MAG: trypsin inhibitor-like cysteine-rich domain-containing protein [Candidatus Diapherotrites archaeon]|uniref:Trypsin inhibitor-like cysteine-rich domain-containing protein n=1 Tax=Candidatus Iainarchaeum sp. TaxID=3101447 RepID=A0A8T4L3J4_9ARCH|nr:trypsin inhibitor-like cysteine-rich domain-containing protein [Candidatus Diapherotrites archaeon]